MYAPDAPGKVKPPGPSMFAVDPAAENDNVPPYARLVLYDLTSAGHVHQRVGTKSEGPGEA